MNRLPDLPDLPVNPRWRAYVRQHLPPLDIAAERESEIVDELALQLEAAYDAAISRGARHEDALREASSEIPDWGIFAARIAHIERSSPIAWPTTFAEATAVKKSRATRSSTPAAAPASGGLMRGFTRDLARAARGLLRAPAFTTVSLLTLTLGLGLAAAAFTVVDAVLIRPLPYTDSDRLVLVHATVPPEGRDTPEITFPDSRDLAAETRVFERVATVLPYAGTNTSIDPPGRIQGLFVSSEFFAVFGVHPALGRAFADTDGTTGQARVAIIAHGYWQRLGSPADIVGRIIVLDERPRTIVGVAPAGFSFALIQQPADVFIPIGSGELGFLESRAVRAFRVVGRLAPGVSIEQANAAASTVAARLQRAFPDTNLGRDLSVRSLDADIVSEVKGILSLVAALVALVLVVAAVNLTSLLLARAVTRAREMAVRLALGANRWRLVREALAESLVLAAWGGAGGVLLAEALLAGLGRVPGLTLPRLEEIALGSRTLAAVGGAAAIVALAGALIPLFLMHRLQSTATLRTGHETSDRRTGRIRGLLVAGQTSLAFMLLASAALLAVSLHTLLSQPAGFDTRDVVTMRLAVPAARYATRDSTVAFYRGFLETLRSQPGVGAAGVVSALPLAGGSSSALLVEGRESTPEAMRPTVGWHWTSRDYFAAMGMAMVRGRDFTDEDLARQQHVTIVNDTLARAQFPGEDPIGKRVYYGPVPPGGVTDWHVIVGVVGDVRHRTLEQPPDARAYDLFGQHWGRNVALAIRSPEDPARVGRAVRTLLAERDPLLALFAVQSTADLVSASTATRRLVLWLVAGFSLAGLAVALVGVYGTVSYMVAQRTRELGVRIALGASAPDIRRLVLGYGFRIACTGVVFGVAGAWAMRGVIDSQLFGVRATNAPILAATAFGLLLAAIAACVVPAQRAIAVDPAASLKAE